MISKAKLKYIGSLKRKKVREAEGLFLVEGLRTCEALQDSEYEIELLLHASISHQSPRLQTLLRHSKNAGVTVEEVEENVLQKISDTETSQGILAVVRTRKFNLSDIPRKEPSFILALDQIREPGNLGTIIRSAAWFGVHGILLGKNTVEFTNPKVIRSSMGAGFHLPILQEIDLQTLLPQLSGQGYQVVVADTKAARHFETFDFSQRCVLVLGNETTGVEPALKRIATETIMIPKRGYGDSLNVAVTAGIMLSQMSKRL